MANEFRYQIVFDTALMPAGAEAAENAIERIDRRAKATDTRSRESSAEAARAMRANADKARVAEFAYYDLDKAMQRTTASSHSFSAGATKVTRSTRDSSRALLLFSQGFEDAQYGIRGVLNNIPGLVMAIGGTAGIAGAISIAAVAGSVLWEKFGGAKEAVKQLGFAADEAVEKVSEVARNMGAMVSDAIAEGEATLRRADEAAEALRQKWTETKSAENSYATATLSNAEKIAEAQRNIAEILGLQIDHFAELEAQHAAEEARRKLAAQQAIAEQEKRVADAAEEAELAEQKRAAQIRLIQEKEAELEKRREALELARQERDMLQRLAQDADAKFVAAHTPIAALTSDVNARIAEALKTGKAAREKLDSMSFRAQLEGLEEQVAALEDAVVGRDSRLQSELDRLSNQSNAAQIKLEDAAKAAGVKIQEISETLAIDTFVSESAIALEKSQELAKQASEIAGKISAGNEQQAAAKAAIEQAASDGKITAEELAGLSRNTSDLIGGLQMGISSSNTNIWQLIGIMKQFQDTTTVMEREIKVIKARGSR